jgi:hypothetical protein
MRRLKALTALTCGIALAGLLGVAVQAGTTIVSRTGDLVEVEVVPGTDPSVQGLRIRTVRPGGQQVDELIESTYDLPADVGPAIALAPDDGQPVVVWSRFEDTDFELAMSRRSLEGDWPSHVLLTDNYSADTMPEFAVDSADRVHVLWWGGGAGAPLSFACFNSTTGEPVCPVEDPFAPRRVFRPRTSGPIEEGAGGLDDPGVITSRILASNEACALNPGVAPEHGVVATCEIGRPAVYQYANCLLSVAIYDTRQSYWKITNTDLSTATLSGSAIRDIVQGMVDASCY